MNKWISVKDKMPEIYDTCLVAYHGRVVLGKCMGDYWFYSDDVGGYSYHTLEITHWQPLPQPPEEE